MTQVNTNGVVSLREPFTSTSSSGSNFDSVSSPPVIAPFWDDININNGGVVYYRQDFSSFAADLVRQEVSSQYPEVGSFYPSLLFVATWDRVAAFNSNVNVSGLFNTFQVIIVSDGSLSFVKFIYGDIEWGGSSTLIGVSAGDGFNFISHSSSLSSSILSIDGTSVTYRVDSKLCHDRQLTLFDAIARMSLFDDGVGMISLAALNLVILYLWLIHH